MRPYFHMSDTDSVLGVARFELEQKTAEIAGISLREDRLGELEKRIEALEGEVALLKRRTWWSMLKDMFR